MPVDLEKSVALEDDPGGRVIVADQPEVIIVPPHPERPVLSPPLIIAGALVSLALIIAGVLQSTETRRSEVVFNEIVLPCTVTASEDINIRIGPGLEYPRAWILSAGKTQIAAGKTADNWLQVRNGWMPAENIVFEPEEICAGLPLIGTPLIFNDDILPPLMVRELPDWREVLGENFATTANRWMDAATEREITPQEGELSIAAGMKVYPAALENHFGDAYYTFTARWAVSEPTARLIAYFGGNYRLEIQADGALFVYDETNQIISEPVNISVTGAFTISILYTQNSIRIFSGETMLTTVENMPVTSGGFYLGIEGIGAVVRIDRVEIQLAP